MYVAFPHYEMYSASELPSNRMSVSLQVQPWLGRTSLPVNMLQLLKSSSGMSLYSRLLLTMIGGDAPPP